MPHELVRSDLVLVHHKKAPFDRAFIINDRATNRYWNTGPLQYEVARWFQRSDLDWQTASEQLKRQFDEPVSDQEITAAYQQFRELGLLELSVSALEQARLQARTYRKALKLFGLRPDKAMRAEVKQFVSEAWKAGGLAARFWARAEHLARAFPNDANAQALVAAFHRALHIDRLARESAHLPAALRWMRVQVPLFDPNPQLERWMGRLNFLFHPLFFLITLVVGIAGFSVYFDRAREIHQRLSFVSGNLGLLFFCTVLMLVLHEYAHAVTCKHYGGEVREIGIIVFLFFIPAAYCDVSDAHLFAGRKQKLWVTFAGTWSTFLLASIGALIFSNTVPTATLNHVGLVLMASGYATVLTNLNPLLPLDGYFFLSDLLGIDNLRDRAPDYAKAWLAAFFTGKPRPPETARNQRIFFAYFVFGTLYQVFYLLLSVGFGWLILVRGGTVLGLLLYIVLVYLFYLRNYVLKVSQLWREAKTKSLFTYALAAGVALTLLVFVPLPVSVTLPTKVREQGRVVTIAPESGLIDTIPEAGAVVKAGEPLFRLRAVGKQIVVPSPASGTFVVTREWMYRAPVDAGAELGAIVTGHVLEGAIPQRDVDTVRGAKDVLANVMGLEVQVAGVKVLPRGKGAPVVQVGIVASGENSLRLEEGLGARLTVHSAKTTSLWRRLWGEQWDRVVLDVWRLL